MTNRYSSTVMCLCQFSRAILLAWYVAQVPANLKVSTTWPRHILHVKGIRLQNPTHSAWLWPDSMTNEKEILAVRRKI